MQLVRHPSLVDDVRLLPASGAARARQLHHLIDLHSAFEAGAALHSAATREPSSLLVRVFVSADELLANVAEEATRERLRAAVTSSEFLAVVQAWIPQLRAASSERPDTGACTVASALAIWDWTVRYFISGEGSKSGAATLALDELAEAITPILAARCLALEAAGCASSRGPELELHPELSHVYAAKAAAELGAKCAELVFGYRKHLRWDAEGCASCYTTEELDLMESLMPGIGSNAGADVIEADGSHPRKAGPCARFDGVDTFMQMRNRLDACLTGARLAKERAAAAIERSFGLVGATV